MLGVWLDQVGTEEINEDHLGAKPCSKQCARIRVEIMHAKYLIKWPHERKF